MSQNMQLVHPTAIISPGARIGEGTRVGAFSMIGPEVTLGNGCEIHEHAIIKGVTTLGDEVKVFPFAVVGLDPQHTKYAGEPTIVKIGNRVTIREAVTVNRGTAFGTGITSIGDDSFIMAYTHIAHDCQIGKHVILANCVQLAGHAEVHDHAFLGGLTAVVQFGRVGRYCYVGGGSGLRKDLPPFLIGKGFDFEVQGVNLVGLNRNGFPPATVSQIKAIYRMFYLQDLTVNQAIEKIPAEIGDTPEVRLFLDFVKSSKVGFLR